MSLWADLFGTVKDHFRLGLSGVRLKNSSGHLLVRNSGDSADAELTASKVKVSGDSMEMNSDAADSGADRKYTLQRPTSGMTAAVTLTLPVDDGNANQAIITDGAGVLGWRYVPLIVRKTADETVNNSSVLQNDDHLKWDVAANEIWEFELFLLTSSGSATPDWQWAWSVPSGATMRWAAAQQGANLFLDAPATGTAQQALNTEGSTITSGSGASIEGGVFFRGIVIVGGTAGTIQLRWAQNTANASDSKVLAHSFLKACRIG